MLTGALGVAYSVLYLEYGWHTVVAQVILFTDRALLFWGNFCYHKTHPTSKQDDVIYSL